MPTTVPGQYNTYLPNLSASGNLVVDFSRNPKSFALPEWAQYVPVKKNVGRYLLMTIEMAGRVLNTDGADFYWPDEGEAPTGYGNLEEFSFESFVTKRYAFSFRMGELAAEQAEWDVLASHARYSAQRAMTWRTQALVTIATTVGNWPASNTTAVSSISGVTGKWDVSTTARNDIKRTLDYGADLIFRSTLGAVQPEDMMLVMSPGCARKLSISQEIVDYIKGSPSAEKLITKTLSRANRYGLPEYLFGYKIVIEDAVKVTSRKGATKVTQYVLPDTTPFMCSRVGGLDGVESAPAFSTFQVFLKEEMTVESKHDRDNRRQLGRVVDDFAGRLVAPISGVLFQDAVAV